MAIKLQTSPLALLLVIAYCAVRAASAPTPAPTPTKAPPPSVATKDDIWTWCVEDADDYPTCTAMTQVLANIDTNKARTHNCIIGDGDEDCMIKVQAGDAKFAILDGGEIWEAYSEYGLIPIRTEVSLLEGRYYGVGIVKKTKCPGSLAALKGKRSCHTGYGRSSGWVLPISFMLQNKIMPLVTTGPQQHDIESVKAFFSESCAADSEAAKSICTACDQKTACTLADKYYDYEGAFRGVVEDECDIAFTKHTIVAAYSTGGPTAQGDWVGLMDASNYQIVCPTANFNGQFCTDASNYKACTFGDAPGHAIMITPSFPAAEQAEFQDIMDKANSDSAFNNLFFSGNNVKGNLFAADASKTLPYNGTVVALLETLYPKIQYLESVNNQTTSSPPSAGTATTSSLLLTIAAALAYFLVQ